MRDTITDPSFVFPESYEADTYKMQQQWYLNNYTSLQQTTSYQPNDTVSDEEYIRRLQAMPTEVEMPFNSIVKGCIEMYVNRRRSQVERMLGMMSYYLPIFEQALEQEGVPLELRYLPIIESALDANAVSRAGATGLWQFMSPTARGLGMEISSLVDERRDPVVSSKMAARYLRQLYDIYNDWSLAIAAYNCGPGNVNKALKRAGEGKKDFWEIYAHLPRETRGYLPGFIAANYAMNYYAQHGISPVLAKKPLITDSIHVTKRVHFQQIADVLNIPIEEIKILNPQYRKNVIPGDVKPYSLVLPSHLTLAYIMSEDSIIAHNAHLYERRGLVEPADGTTRISEDGNYIIKEVVKYHKVRRGETFSQLARRYGVTIASIKKANGIKYLRYGRTIKIVTTERVPKPEEPKEEKTEEVESAETVDTTDKDTAVENDSIDVSEETIPATFDEIADSLGIPNPAVPDSVKTNITVATDVSDNFEDTIVPTEEEETTEEDTESEAESEADQRIRDTFANRQTQPVEQPEAEPEKVVEEAQPEKVVEQPKPKKEQPKPKYAKVRKGDTLSKIAKRNGVSLSKIRRLNPNINPNRIKPGDRIRIK